MKVVEALLEGPLTVGQIVEKTGEEQSNISHQLKNLRDCNIIIFKKDGKSKIYHLNKKTVEPMLVLVKKHIKTYCCGCKYQVIEGC
jgi:DNA-binding transcriptional ArsR family regulator